MVYRRKSVETTNKTVMKGVQFIVDNYNKRFPKKRTHLYVKRRIEDFLKSTLPSSPSHCSTYSSCIWWLMRRQWGFVCNNTHIAGCWELSSVGKWVNDTSILDTIDIILFMHSYGVWEEKSYKRPAFNLFKLLQNAKLNGDALHEEILGGKKDLEKQIDKFIHWVGVDDLCSP